MNYQALYAPMTPYRSASREELEELGWYLTRDQMLRHPDRDDIDVPLTSCSVAITLKDGVYYWLPAGVIEVEPHFTVVDYNRN